VWYRAVSDFEGVSVEEAGAGLGPLEAGARGLSRGGPQVQVGEDSADIACLVNEGEDIHACAAAGTYERPTSYTFRMRRAQERRTSRGTRSSVSGTGSAVSAFPESPCRLR